MDNIDRRLCAIRDRSWAKCFDGWQSYAALKGEYAEWLRRLRMAGVSDFARACLTENLLITKQKLKEKIMTKTNKSNDEIVWNFEVNGVPYDYEMTSKERALVAAQEIFDEMVMDDCPAPGKTHIGTCVLIKICYPERGDGGHEVARITVPLMSEPFYSDRQEHGTWNKSGTGCW